MPYRANIDPMAPRFKLAKFLLDPSNSMLKITCKTLEVMRDCATPFESVVADAAIMALLGEIALIEADKKLKMGVREED
jgi:hypothetical protein